MNLQTSEFQEFYAANEEWLRPYAVFCFLRDLFGTAQHWHWGVLSRPTAQVNPWPDSHVAMPKLLFLLSISISGARDYSCALHIML